MIQNLKKNDLLLRYGENWKLLGAEMVGHSLGVGVEALLESTNGKRFTPQIV